MNINAECDAAAAATVVAAAAAADSMLIKICQIYELLKWLP